MSIERADIRLGLREGQDPYAYRVDQQVKDGRISQGAEGGKVEEVLEIRGQYT